MSFMLSCSLIAITYGYLIYLRSSTGSKRSSTAPKCISSSGWQRSAIFESSSGCNETACSSSEWSQIHGNIFASANILLTLSRIYMVNIMHFRKIVDFWVLCLRLIFISVLWFTNILGLFLGYYFACIDLSVTSKNIIVLFIFIKLGQIKLNFLDFC